MDDLRNRYRQTPRGHAGFTPRPMVREVAARQAVPMPAPINPVPAAKPEKGRRRVISVKLMRKPTKFVRKAASYIYKSRVFKLASRNLNRVPWSAWRSRRLQATALFMLIVTSIAVMLMSNVAEAAITIRGNSSGSAGGAVSLQTNGATSGSTGTGGTSLAIQSGGSTQVGDVLVAAVNVKSSSITITAPSGWTQLQLTKDGGGSTLTQGLYWRQATSADTGTQTYTWTLSASVKSAGIIMDYTGVASSSPIDTSSGKGNTASTTVSTTGITTTVANDMLVGFFGEPGLGTFTATSMSSGIAKTSFSAGTPAGSDNGVAAAYQNLSATCSASCTQTATITSNVSVGQLVAIKPASATALSLNMPTGTVQNDVMIATVTITGGSGVTISAPAGWTSIQNTNTPGNEIKTQSWWKAAGASEAGPYAFSWTGSQRAAGVIVSYSGVDNSSPIDASASQTNASGAAITAPSVTPSHNNDMLVAAWGVNAASANLSSTSPLNSETFSAAQGSSGPNSASSGMGDQLLSGGASTATGTRTASSSTTSVTIGQLMALTPVTANLTQASHAWYSQPTIQAGVNWIGRYNPVSSQLNAVAYGGGKYVAVTNGTAGYSSDGTTWTQGVSQTGSWVSIAYGNSKFVAVKGNGTTTDVQTSPDGNTWTSQTTPTTGGWTSVTYGNGLFVAVSGTSGAIMTSPDGVTWTSRTGANTNYLSGVTYGNGLFVAVDNVSSGSDVETSPDGITWTARTTPTNQWQAVTYGNGLFVATSNSGTGNRVMTSPDGITWTSQTSAADLAWVSVAYGGGLYVAVANSGSGNMVMTSPDGVTWTGRAGVTGGAWYGVTYGNGIFVAVGFGSSIKDGIMTSDSLVHATANAWTRRTSVSGQWRRVIYANGQFLAASSATTSSNQLMTSPDGINWTPHSLSGTHAVSAIAYGNGLYVALDSEASGSDAWTSPDGVTWTNHTTPAGATKWQNMTYANGLFVAVSPDNTSTTSAIMTSPDGITWTYRTAPLIGSWQGVAYGNGLFVAVDDNVSSTDVITSPDGITWTTRTGAAQSSWSDLSYGNGLFVTVSNSGTGTTGNQIMTSPDGITWTLRTDPVVNQWFSVTYGNGLFVAVSYNAASASNEIMASPDGVTWTSRAAPSIAAFDSVAYGNGLFVAVDAGNNGSDVSTAPGIDASVGSMIGSQDTALTNTTSDSVRLRMNVGVNAGSSSYPLKAADQRKFSLQYASLTPGGSCSTGQTYYDVGTSPWVSRTDPLDNGWDAVTYGNGKFVAISSTISGSDVMTSLDGKTWTTSTTPGSGGNWSSVTYGNGLFVAVGSNEVMTSPDGITWTSRTPASSNVWQAVTYANGLFVAVASNSTGSSNMVMTSPDGITWTSRATPNTYPYQAVTYGNGLFVAVANNNLAADVMTSPDGITWTSRNGAATNLWDSVTYGNGLFVAVDKSSTGTDVMTSYDGTYWTSRSTPSKTWYSVTYGNGQFVAVSGDGTTSDVMTSYDGVNWLQGTVPNTNGWNGVVYGNGVFAAVSTTGTGNEIMTMSPPVNWGGLTANNYGTVVGSGPTEGSGSIIAENYITDNYFTSPNDVAVGNYGHWDFDLDLSKASYDSTYCFRIVDVGSLALNSYSTYPQITRCVGAPPLQRRLRHNDAFCGNARNKFFWSRAGV